jgi:hypothetical protein
MYSSSISHPCNSTAAAGTTAVRLNADDHMLAAATLPAAQEIRMDAVHWMLGMSACSKRSPSISIARLALLPREGRLLSC